jgi:hypothetical protein
MAAAPLIKRLAAATPALNRQTPFIKGLRIQAFTSAGATLYGVDQPSPQSTTKFQRFAQTVSGNKAFPLATAMNTPQNTSGGALSDLNQLRCVVIPADVPAIRARGDQVAAAGSAIVGAGGGTAAGDATLSVKGTTTANLLAGSVLLSLASSGVNVKTIISGDSFTVANDTTQYYFTGGGTLTLNGTTEINVGITPPLVVAQTAGWAVTIVAATGKVIFLGTAPAVGANVDVWVNDAADITTVTGGALTASQPYDIAMNEVFHASAAVDLIKLS